MKKKYSVTLLRRAQQTVLVVFLGLASVVAWATPFQLPEIRELSLQDKKLAALQSELTRAVAAGKFQQALIPAQSLAAKLVPDTQLGGFAQENLALVQMYTGDWQAGVATMQERIDYLHQGGNFRDPRLARPLFALGVAHYQLSDYAGTVDNLEQAIFVVRTSKGLESLEQTRYDDMLIDSLNKMGRHDDALDRLEASLTIKRQALDKGPELEQALADGAKWYRVLEEPNREVGLQQERLDILEDSLGKDSPELVPVLYDLAASYQRRIKEDIDQLRDLKKAESNLSYSYVQTDRLQRAMERNFDADFSDERELKDAEWKSSQALRRALSLEEDKKEPDTKGLADAYVHMGDHYQLIGLRRKARSYYQKAYDLLTKKGATELRDQFFSQPVMLYERYPKKPEAAEPDVLAAYNGEAELVMDVTSQGKVRNVDVLSVKPKEASLLENKAKRFGRDAIFRPRFTDDGMVTTKEMHYVYRFQPSLETP